MINAAEFLKWLAIFGVPTGHSGGGAVTERQVQQSAFNYQSSSGVNDAFIVNLNPAVLTLTDNLLVSMNSESLTNLTSSPTLKINSLAPVPITLWSGLSVLPGDIMPNSSYLFIYNLNSNEFQLINPSVSLANTTLVQRNFYNYATDAGTTNAYVVTLIPAPVGSFSNGFQIFTTISATNTGASTLTVNGVTNNIYFPNGSNPYAGALTINKLASFIYSVNLGGWVLQNPYNAAIVNPWVDQTTTPITMAPNTGYTSDDGSTLVVFSLPTTSAIGDWVEINGKGSGLWTIHQAAGQQIFISPNNTTLGAGGSLSSVNQYDCVRLRCLTANTFWVVVSEQGTGLTFV